MKKQESEKTIEARLVQEVKKLGGIALKHSSQFHRGMPDRIVILPTGLIYFIELKSSGKKPEGLQELAHKQLRDLGQTVYVIDSSEKLEDFIFLAKYEIVERRAAR